MTTLWLNRVYVVGLCLAMALVLGCETQELREPDIEEPVPIPVSVVPVGVIEQIEEPLPTPAPVLAIPVGVIEQEEEVYQTSYVSSVWVGDQGDGTYKNPILFADYSDPDVCRVGSDYYMTASSYTCMPGLPILHSKDLVSWELIAHALPRMYPEVVYDQTQHANSVWAPSIRHHNGEFYIYWGDPDLGICMVKAIDAAGPWTKPVVVKSGQGLIDACPLWDDDGQVYLIHAWAASRAQINSIFTVHKMNVEGTRVVDEGRHVFDGNDEYAVLEGAKLYKHQGYYYILTSCSGPINGWQIALRSRDIWGPYEDKTVMAQSNSVYRDGLHQGAWVQTPSGESWFIHSQRRQPYGRLTYLEPVEWIDGWPVFGFDKAEDGFGHPVLSYTKPVTKRSFPIVTPAESDEFNEGTLGPQWQWCANPDIRWSVLLAENDYLRLMAIEKPAATTNLMDVPNLLLQKMPAPAFTATTKMTFSSAGPGRQAGILVFGRDYAYLGVSGDQGNYALSKVVCDNAHKGGHEQVVGRAFVGEDTLYLRVEISENQGKAQFSYSLDGEIFLPVGDVFNTREGDSVGAKIGLFCISESDMGRGGYADFDWFRIEK